MPELRTLVTVRRPELPPIPERAFPRQVTGPDSELFDSVE
jgi:hypothetical protein